MERAAFAIYLFVLVFGPLAFGAVHTYAYSVVTLGVLAAGLFVLRGNIKKNVKNRVYEFRIPQTGLGYLFLSLFIFMLCQILPLPGALLESLAPEAWVVGLKSLPASDAAPVAGLTKEWFAFAPYSHPVRMSLIQWTVYGLFFFGFSQVLNTRKRIDLAVMTILVLGCFEVIYGMIETYSGHEQIWWFKKASGFGKITGTYTGPNRFAGFIELCLMLAAGYMVALGERRMKRRVSKFVTNSLRSRISRWLQAEQQLNKRLFIFSMGVVIGIGLIFSSARGGMIGAAGGLLCFSALSLYRRGLRRKGLVIFALFLVTAVYALQIGVEEPLTKFKSFSIDMESRNNLTRRTLLLFKDYRFAGVGLGNYPHAFPKYQDFEFKEYFVDYAHNDWAQFLAEGGTVGFFLLLTGMGYFIYKTFRLWLNRGDPFAVGLGLTAFAAMTAIGIYSYTDFNLHIPANFMTLTAIVAIGYSALHLQQRHGNEKSLYPYRILPLRYRGACVLIMVLAMILWSGFWSVRHFMAEAFCNTVPNTTLNRDQTPPLAEIKEAIQWDRHNAEYWYKLGREFIRLRDAERTDLSLTEADRRGRQTELIGALEEAVRLNPFREEYHLRLGWEYFHYWRFFDPQEKWLSAADRSMERAAYFASDKRSSGHFSLGNYWIIRSKTIDPGAPAWEIDWTRAIWHYQKAQVLSPWKEFAEKILKFVWEYYPDRSFAGRVLLEEYHDLLKGLP